MPIKPQNAGVPEGHANGGMNSFEKPLWRHIDELIESNERVVKAMRRFLFSMGFFASFIRGILLGFGWVVGTTIVVGLFLYFLRSFDSTPLIGEFISRIIDYLELQR
jgi:hypothetical protein